MILGKGTITIRDKDGNFLMGGICNSFEVKLQDDEIPAVLSKGYFIGQGQVFLGARRPGKKTYKEHIEATVKAEGDRYMEAWWIGRWGYMSAAKSARYLKLCKYLRRARGNWS